MGYFLMVWLFRFYTPNDSFEVWLWCLASVAVAVAVALTSVAGLLRTNEERRRTDTLYASGCCSKR